ncbi:helix-turn-helix domain-containing protein [Gemmiger sp.]
MCEVLHISTKTGYKLIHDEKVQAMKIGRSYRIPKAHLLAYLQIGTRQCRGSNRQR